MTNWTTRFICRYQTEEHYEMRSRKTGETSRVVAHDDGRLTPEYGDDWEGGMFTAFCEHLRDHRLNYERWHTEYFVPRFGASELQPPKASEITAMRHLAGFDD